MCTVCECMPDFTIAINQSDSYACDDLFQRMFGGRGEKIGRIQCGATVRVRRSRPPVTWCLEAYNSVEETETLYPKQIANPMHRVWNFVYASSSWTDILPSNPRYRQDPGFPETLLPEQMPYAVRKSNLCGSNQNFAIDNDVNEPTGT